MTDSLPHAEEIKTRLSAVEKSIAELRAEVVGEDRVTTLRIEALNAQMDILKSELKVQENEIRAELAQKVSKDRYDIFEKILTALILAVLLGIAGAVMNQVVSGGIVQ